MKDLKISAPEHRMFGWNCDCQGSRKKEKRDAAAIPHSAGISTEMAEAMTRCLWFQDGWQCRHIRERHATKDLHYTYIRILTAIRVYEYRLDGVCMYYVNMFICSSYTVENRAPHPEDRTEKKSPLHILPPGCGSRHEGGHSLWRGLQRFEQPWLQHKAQTLPTSFWATTLCNLHNL